MINIISGVAVAGIALATIAMICTLSVFNGFQSLVAQQFTAFDPELKIVPAKGKSLLINEERIVQVRELPEVSIAVLAIEDKVMVQHNGRQAMVMLKGVDSNFTQLTDIKNILIGDGEISLHDSINNYAIPGAGLVSTLNSGIYFVEPLEIYAPKRGKKVSLTNPASNFRKGYLHASGLIFALNQPKYDENYILTSIEFTREIFGRKEYEATTLELKLNEGCNTLTVQNKIKNILGKEFIVENRYEQQKDIFKIMQIEKFISYIFLSFILLIACFNIIGSLSMLIIEKKKDVQTLRSLGANNQMITNIFISEGFLISLLGTLSGITIGVIICYAQQEFNLLTFGDSADSFIVNGYPVKIILEDILAVLVTVIVVGILSIGVPIKYLTQNLLKKIHD